MLPEPIRVVKVGGSLFDWPVLPTALKWWLNEQPSVTNVLIAGGGTIVERIRQATSTFSLDDETAHWRAIDVMSLNSRLLAGFVRNAELVLTFSELRSHLDSNSNRRIVFDPREFLRDYENKLPGVVLPRDWSVTSDSIAGRVAEVLKADELVLLKSTDPPAEQTAALAARGFVDGHFPAFNSCCFKTRYVNLRRAAN